MILVKDKIWELLKLKQNQRHNRCHGNGTMGVIVSFVMYIAGAKSEEHCFNISRVILNWVLCCFSGITYDVITSFNTKTWVALKRKKIDQKGESSKKSLSNKQQLFFTS